MGGQPERRRLRRVVRLTFWSVLLWTALWAFFASQIYLLSDGKVGWARALAHAAAVVRLGGA